MSQKHWDRMVAGVSSTTGIKQESIIRLVPKCVCNWAKRKPKGMKPTRECSQKEKMLRALLVLDGMTYHFQDIMCDGAKTPLEHFVHDVYAIAHAAHGACSGCGNDSNWLDCIDMNAKILNDANIWDFEKVLKDAKKDRKKSSKGILHAMGIKD